MNKDEVLNILQNSENSKSLKVETLLHAIFNIDDWKWLQDLCIQTSSSDDEDLSGLSLTGLGHIARMHKQIELEKVIPFLKKIIDDNNHLSGRASDALDDIETFIK